MRKRAWSIDTRQKLIGDQSVSVERIRYVNHRKKIIQVGKDVV